MTVAKDKTMLLVCLELQLPEQTHAQQCLLGAGGRWCLGFGIDAQRRAVFLRALGQAMADGRWIKPWVHARNLDLSSLPGLALPQRPPEYDGFGRCSDWLSIRGRGCMSGLAGSELAREVVEYHAEVIEVAAAAKVLATHDAQRLLRAGRGLVKRVRDHVFMAERAEMKGGLLSCPAWQEAACDATQGSSPQATVRCDGFARLLSVGGGALPAEGAKGKRYLLLRADTPTLEVYVERHPEAAVTALSSLPLALFQADDLVSDSTLTLAAPPHGSASSSDRGSMRSSGGSDVEATRTPRGAIEAGLGAAAGLQETDCWSGQWRLELVDQIPLGVLGTWGQVTQGKQGGGKDTLAIVNGAGRVFEIQLPSIEAASNWKVQVCHCTHKQSK